jgi:hypothetical protein
MDNFKGDDTGFWRELNIWTGSNSFVEIQSSKDSCLLEFGL